ncbi:MAG: carboxypeptidase-like regulatory domain-containing protein [Pirellulales bacterium]
MNRLAEICSAGSELWWPAQRMHPLTARMARVMDCGLRRTSRMSLSGALLVALLAVVLLPGVSAEPQQASAQGKTPKPAPAEGNALDSQSPKPSEKKSAATEEEAPQQPLTISASGKVVDQHATPVAGARVYLRESATYRVSENPYERHPQDVLAETKTNEQGEFRFERVAFPPFRNDWGGPLWDVVVMADGYGVGWQHLPAPTQRTELKVVLVPEATIGGRLVDEMGRPADNVQVQIVGIAPLGSPPRESNAEPDRLDLGFSKLAPTVRTDSNGRFAFRGLPPGKRIALSTDDKRFVREGFYSATTPAQQPDLIDVSYSKGERRERARPVHTGDFTVVLIAGPTLQVHVVLADTGKPLSAAKVVLSWESYGQHAVSDGEGRFSFYGMRADEFNVWARAPEDSDYLSRTTHVRFSPDKMHEEIELSLPQGDIVTGIVVDKKTGRGVPKVQVIHQAGPPEGTTDDAARPELAAQPATTDADGRFRLAVPPGKAVIHLMGPVDGYDVPDRVQQRQDPRAGYRQTVDVVPGQALDGLRFELGRGLVIEGTVLDPEGLPVGGARVTWRDPSYRRRQQTASTDQEGRFSLGGLPAATQPELIVTHSDRKLMGKVQVAAAEEAEEATGTGVTREVSIEVKLEQAASITGQALLGDKPYPGVRVYLMVERADLAGRGPGLASTGEGAVTDEHGRYRLEPVQAGQKLFVSANIGREQPKGGIVNIKLEPGEERELPPFEFLVLDASVSGVVVDPDGNPVAGVTVSASEQGGGSIAGGFTRQPTGPDGRFTIPRLPSSPLQLMAYIRLPDDATDRRIRFPAIVRIQPGQTDVRIVLDPKLQRAGQR